MLGFGSNCLDINPCEDWIKYGDHKCFKVIEKIESQPEALVECHNMQASMITINDLDENNFISNLLKNYRKDSDSAWLGMTYVDGEFNWIGNYSAKYWNWAKEAARDGSVKCVQMELQDNKLGQWVDDSCSKKELVVCQKKQVDLSVVLEAVQNLSKIVDNQSNKIDE